MSGYSMALALKSYKDGDLVSARNRLDQYFHNNKDNDGDAVAIAFDATVLILEGKSEKAANRFAQGRNLAKVGMTGDDSIYIQEYCLYYECLIENGSGCASHRNAALNVNHSSKVGRWLNFPEGNF